MQCQVLIQSVAQLADMYPRHEWEEIAACCDATICLGVNDPTSAKFISEKCGMTTIQVTNNQSPADAVVFPAAKQYSAVFHDAQQHAARSHATG